MNSEIKMVRKQLLAWGAKQPPEIKSNCELVAQNIGALASRPDNEPLRNITIQNIARLAKLAEQNSAHK